MTRPLAIQTIAELMECTPIRIIDAPITGDCWSFGPFGNTLRYHRPPLREFEPHKVRSIVAALHERFQRTASKVIPEGEELTLEEIVSRIGAHPSAIPNPYLPYTILLHYALTRPEHISQDERAGLIFAAKTLLPVFRDSATTDVLCAAATFMADLIRWLVTHEFDFATALVLGEKTLHALRNRSMDPTNPPLAYDYAVADILDALYNARWQFLKAQDYVTAQERRKAIEEMKAFLDVELRPAVENRNRRCRELHQSKFERECAVSELVLHHRALTLRHALAREIDKHSPTASRDWISLAEAYIKLDDPLNSSGALCAGLDEILDLLNTGRPIELYRDSTRTLISLLTATMESVHFGSTDAWRDMSRRLIAAWIFLGETARATTLLREYLASLLFDLEGAENEFVRSGLRSGADDWLGYAMLVGDCNSTLFSDTFAIIRGIRLPEFAPRLDVGILRTHVTRVASCIGIATSQQGEPRWRFCREAFSLARSLHELYLRSVADTTHKGKDPTSAESWQALISRLTGQLGLVGLTEAVRKDGALPTRLIIEADGHSVHVPWTGLLVECIPEVEGIFTTRIGLVESHCPPLPVSGDGIEIINGFPERDSSNKPDRFHHDLRSWGISIRPGPHRYPQTEAEFRECLQAPAKLIIMGCHGKQERLGAPLQLQVGTKWVEADALLEGLKLPFATTIICCTCLGASGLNEAGGRWLSLPELLITAGARVVVGNRWHAWTDDETFIPMLELLKRLTQHATCNSIWETAYDVTSFMKRLKSAHGEPRQWAGWATWTARRFLDEP